ncbi:hypothetical protein M2283_008992 [Streptomyces pseudovenezuelae]|uniref:TniQ domain-containing protein n=1 Tax=Streptomyces pseudovenezuelae TaxID=67350 RepID=A0ABT6LZC0_9ACTN|nr:hypothetical protein [Streptomyces pseudovenezuelae]
MAAPVLPAWTIRLTRDELAVIAEVTGVAEHILAAMTLQRWDGHAVVILPRHRRVNRRVLWGRAGSRFCPLRLADSGGRWQAAWRLSWSFACTDHHVLLADRCPACQRIPRLRAHPRQESPRPGLCSGAAPDGGPRPPRCHHPLTDIPVTENPRDSTLAETQHLIDTALAAPGDPVRWPLYGPGGAPLNVVLRDARSLGALILNHATPSDLRPFAPPDVLDRLERYRASPLPASSQRAPDTRPSDLHSHFAPGDAAATAVAVTAAFDILRAENTRCAARAVRWLTDRVAASGRPLHPANVVTLGGTISPALEAALRCSRETKLMPVARLRHRTAIDSTRPPANHDSRARLLPTALWPEWALRLSPRHPSGRRAAQRADELLTVACLLAGNTTSIRATVRLTGTSVSSHNVSTFLATLTRHQDGADLLRALILLADRLDTHGAPIDYARRRALFTTRSRFISPQSWMDLQRRLRSNPRCRCRARPTLALPGPDRIARAPRPLRHRARHPRSTPALPALSLADPARRGRTAHPHRTHAPRRARHRRIRPMGTPAARPPTERSRAPGAGPGQHHRQPAPPGRARRRLLRRPARPRPGHHHGPHHLPAVPAPPRLEPTAVSPHPVHRHPRRGMAYLVRGGPAVPTGHRRPGRNKPGHRPPRTTQERRHHAPRLAARKYPVYLCRASAPADTATDVSRRRPTAPVPAVCRDRSSRGVRSDPGGSGAVLDGAAVAAPSWPRRPATVDNRGARLPCMDAPLRGRGKARYTGSAYR